MREFKFGAWREIETAPKDGKHFLARVRSVFDEYDEDDRLIRKGNVRHFSVVAYFAFGGFVEYPWNGSIVQNHTFTHWMPLPPPPSQELAA